MEILVSNDFMISDIILLAVLSGFLFKLSTKCGALWESCEKAGRNQIYVWGNSLDDWRSLRGLTPYNSVMSVVCSVCVLLTDETDIFCITDSSGYNKNHSWPSSHQSHFWDLPFIWHWMQFSEILMSLF